MVHPASSSGAPIYGGIGHYTKVLRALWRTSVRLTYYLAVYLVVYSHAVLVVLLVPQQVARLLAQQLHQS